ncbi:hypothetical protein HG530_013761 [Fusarium avenaceum]|nr:hypothetical protein HG530_013761 [Fusarium avenaceum]
MNRTEHPIVTTKTHVKSHRIYTGEPVALRVDGTGSCVDEHIIEEATESTAKEGSHHRNLITPVSSEFYTEIFSLDSPRSSSHQQTTPRFRIRSWTGTDVVAVGHGKDDKLQNGAGNKFGEEHASACHELSRICAEDAGGCVLANNGSDTRTAFICVEGRFVVSVHDSCGGHGSEDLGNGIYGKLSPWVTSEQTICQCHGWVQVTTRFTANIHSKHDTEAKFMSVMNSITDDDGDLPPSP